MIGFNYIYNTIFYWNYILLQYTGILFIVYITYTFLNFILQTLYFIQW